MTDWRADYVIEARVEDPGPDLRARCAVAIELLHADGADFVLEEAGVPVAYCCYNARIAEAVQIYFNAHDDGFSGDPTSLWIDDVSVKVQ